MGAESDTEQLVSLCCFRRSNVFLCSWGSTALWVLILFKFVVIVLEQKFCVITDSSNPSHSVGTTWKKTFNSTWTKMKMDNSN